MKSSIRTRSLQDYNPLLIAGVLLLLAISVPMVYSTTIGQSSAPIFALSGTFTKHLIWVALGLGLWLFLSLVDYQMLAGLAIPLYLASIAALVAVLAR
jgi:rod shape determining protein RodA